MIEKKIEKLEAVYDAALVAISEIVEIAANARAQIDSAAMELNAAETGAQSDPRPVSYWRDVLIQNLAIEIEAKDPTNGQTVN